MTIPKKRARNSERDRAYHKAYRDANKDKRKNGMLLWRFNITLEQYNAMHEAQNGLCKVCGKEESATKNNSEEPRKLAVDHDHTTGKVRGLLCASCNVKLGHYEGLKPLVPLFDKYLEEAVRL